MAQTDLTYSRLLPPNQTHLEGAMVNAIMPRPETLPEVIKTLYRPDDIASRLLPWQGWAFDAPVWPKRPHAWDMDTVDELRRAIIKGSWNAHRSQGTLGGYRTIARWLGAEIPFAVTPPAKTYLGESLSIAQRNAALARYPQIRVYPYRHEGIAHGIFPEYNAFGSVGHPVESSAPDRLGEQAYWWQSGEETPITTLRLTPPAEIFGSGQIEVRRPGKSGRGTYLSHFCCYIPETTAKQRLYRISLDQAYTQDLASVHMALVQPNIYTQSVPFEGVALTGKRRGFILDSPLNGFILRTNAHDRLFKRLVAVDPTKELPARWAGSFANASRLGFPPYTAELGVRIRSSIFSRQAGRYVYGFLPEINRTVKRVLEVLDGLSRVKAVRDRVLAHIRTWTPARAGRWKCGTLKCGQVIF